MGSLEKKRLLGSSPFFYRFLKNVSPKLSCGFIEKTGCWKLPCFFTLKALRIVKYFNFNQSKTICPNLRFWVQPKEQFVKSYSTLVENSTTRLSFLIKDINGKTDHSSVCLYIPLVCFYFTLLSTAFEKVCGVFEAHFYHRFFKNY